VNLSSQNEFEDISLTLIALKQKGLLTAPTAIHNDENGRLNGSIIKKQSSIMETLFATLFHEAKVPTSDQEELALWRDLQLFELLGLRSHELRKQLNGLLLRILEQKKPLPNVTGLLLSVAAENDLPENVDKILQLLSSQVESLGSDLAFLAGLENFVSKLPTYILSDEFI
jgi:hypothetical protein